MATAPVVVYSIDVCGSRRDGSSCCRVRRRMTLAAGTASEDTANGGHGGRFDWGSSVAEGRRWK